MSARLSLGVVVLALLFGGVVRAEDKKEAKQPYEGSWKWSVTFNDQTREQTLKLETKEGKPAGVIIAGQNNRETPIADATFKDGVLAFTVTRERQGNKFVSKYNGKLEGDTIKGKIETERDGQTNSRDWEAKREKAEKPAA
jgi:hypothetical protein